MNFIYYNHLCKLLITTRQLVAFLMLLVIFTGCKKFLDKKPDRAAATPASLNDLQALLDNPLNNSRSSGLPELMADNYYITSDDYINNLGNQTRLYSWGKDIDEIVSWQEFYTGPVYYANIVLEQLPLVSSTSAEAEKLNNLKGAALFYRAYAFYQLSQLYCKAYSATAATDPGVVLKMTSNINEVVNRASVQQTYDRIISDLKEAAILLPVAVAVRTRPSKTAALALLARVYLSMRDYVNAGSYANQALQQDSTLLDYNNLIPVGSPVIPTLNAEVIFHSFVGGIPSITAGGRTTKIDSLLYQSYDANDLRKSVFFLQNTGANAGTYRFRGSYHGSLDAGRTFDGLTTDELYLIRAEANAKAGNTSAALGDLNALARKRWANGLFTDITAANTTEVLQKIRIERRKELIFRNQRWTDIRRYNLEDSSITLKRIINGTIYTLPPGDNRWVLLIPWNDITKTGISQNPR